MEYCFDNKSLTISPCNGRTYVGGFFNGKHYYRIINEEYKYMYSFDDLKRLYAMIVPRPLIVYGIIRCNFSEFPYFTLLPNYNASNLEYLQGVLFSLLYLLYDHSKSILTLKKGIHFTYHIIKLS